MTKTGMVRNPQRGRNERRGGKYRRGLAPTNYIGFPKNKIVKMRYVDTYTAVADDVYAQVNYRANSIYDPNHLTGGHQPLGYDQWEQFYNHYVVLGSKITVQLTSGYQANNNDSVIFWSYLSDDTTLSPISTTDTSLIENGKAKYRITNGNMQIGKPIVLTTKYSAKKFFNVDDVKDNLTRLGAAFGANPTEEAYFCFGVGPISGNTNLSGRWTFLVTVDYIVEFSEPKELLQS